MTEENIEVGICNEAGFKRLTPAEVKDYLAAIAWSHPSRRRGFQATFQDKGIGTVANSLMTQFSNLSNSAGVWAHCVSVKLFLPWEHKRMLTVTS